MTLDRSWKAGDTISFELPLTFRTVLYTGMDEDAGHNRHALLYGPVLMALMGAEDLDIRASDLPGRLKAIAGKPLQFAVEGREGVHYQPYWVIEQEPFSCFPTLR